MVEEKDHEDQVDFEKAEYWLSQAQEFVPVVLEKAGQVKGFSSRWKMILSKTEQLPPRLSDLSCHPCFSKNALCREELQSVVKTLKEAIELAELCIQEKYEGKLRMQSNLDSLSGKLDLNLHDCGLLIKTGVLSEVTDAPSTSSSCSCSSEFESIRELMARLQIGHLESKHKALDALVDIMKEDEKNVLSSFGRSSVAALVGLLTATNARIREKAVTVICSLAESGSFEDWLVSEGVLPPLIRLVESGGAVSKEKAAISLQRLSMSAETSRAIVGHGGVGPLVEVCKNGDSVAQAAAACALRNVSAVPEVRQALADEGAVGVMVELLDRGLLLGSKEYAAECLQNLTASNETLRRMVVQEGGIRSLLVYLDGPLPHDPAVGALRNLVGSVSVEMLNSLGLIPRLVNVLRSGSVGAQQAAGAALCRVCVTAEMKRVAGEAGCVPVLVGMLAAKGGGAREAAAQALLGLMGVAENRREVKRDERSVPSLVRLLEPSEGNTAKKYAVGCLAGLASSQKCRKAMVAYGAVGYLKKLAEMEVAGAKKLLDRMEKGKLRGFFSRR